MASITGIGILSRLGNNIEEIWNNLNQEHVMIQKIPIEFNIEEISAKKIRRMDRYSKLALYSSLKAKQDGELTDDINVYRLGTIFSTGYGPMSARIEFMRSLKEEDPDLCSPTVFASNVPNSCVGNVCINLNCKGVSTVLQGGNGISLANIFLKNHKADYIYVGGIEEYCKELTISLNKNNFSKNVDISEACVTFLMEKEQGTKDAYASICTYRECDLTGFPLIEKIDREQAQCNMKEMIQDIKLEVSDIDLVISSQNGCDFDELESVILKEEFKDVPIIENIKQIFGETIGASFYINVMVACLCLKNRCIPKLLKNNNTDLEHINKILVTGYDVSANYMAMVLGKTVWED